MCIFSSALFHSLKPKILVKSNLNAISQVSLATTVVQKLHNLYEKRLIWTFRSWTSFLSHFFDRFDSTFSLQRKTKFQEMHFFPNQFSTDHRKRGRSLSLLTDGLSKQMRNQNVCVVICGFSPLFACHYLLLSAHKVFIHTFTPTVHMAEEHTHAHKHMCKFSM